MSQGLLQVNNLIINKLDKGDVGGGVSLVDGLGGVMAQGGDQDMSFIDAIGNFIYGQLLQWTTSSTRNR